MVNLQAGRSVIINHKAHDGDPLSTAIKEATGSPYCHSSRFIPRGWKYRDVLLKRFGLNDDGTKKLCLEMFWPEIRARWYSDDEIATADALIVAGWFPNVEESISQTILTDIRDGLQYDVEDLFRFLPIIKTIFGDAHEDDAKRHMFCSAWQFKLENSGRPYPLLKANWFDVSPKVLTWPPVITIEPFSNLNP